MIIGIDFDNTIADYTGVFYQVARKLDWMPESKLQSKKSVKQYFITRDIESQWTQLQGIVYGSEILKARPYANCLHTMQCLKQQGHQLYIISHKTRYPIIGDKVDFHTAAINWLTHYGFLNQSDSPFIADQIFFNETVSDKVERIRFLDCDVFIDDLPSILLHPLFPSNCKKILFDQEVTYATDSISCISSWEELIDIK